MNLIVAVDQNWGIGYQNDLLFHIPEDMRFFKEHTMGKTVVMGERTLKSLPGGKPLAGRVNIVLSDDPAFCVQDVTVVRSLPELFCALRAYEEEDIFVIGGGMVYRTLLPYCTRAYITKVQASKQHDTAIPNLDALSAWQIEQCSEPHEHQGLCFRFVTYRNTQIKERSYE